MRGFFREISYYSLFIVVVALMLCGCEAKFEGNGSQRDQIVSFLESSHTPKLIPESEISESLETNPAFYTEFGTYAYLYIEDYYNVERASMPMVEKGSTITIIFRLYPFTRGAISETTLPIYTNDIKYEEAYIKGGLNTEYWNFTPLEITIGKGNVLKSIQEALVGCREGDRIELYMTRNMGYGDSVIGVVEKDSALTLMCEIVSVK